MDEEQGWTFPQSSARLWSDECLAHGQRSQSTIHIITSQLYSHLSFKIKQFIDEILLLIILI